MIKTCDKCGEESNELNVYDKCPECVQKDVEAEAIEAEAREISEYLRKGGHWANVGSYLEGDY